MRGLIYKDVCLFFKGAEKRLLLIIGPNGIYHARSDNGDAERYELLQR